EPTNHLDMRAKDVLLEALADFTGTVVFVSHDRYFIDKLATRVFEIGDGEVHVFPGNYEDYMWRKAGKPLELDVPTGVAPLWNGAAAPLPANPEKPKTRVNPMRVQKLKERCRNLEESIARAEERIASLEAELGNFINPETTVRVTTELQERRQALANLLAEWELLSQEIETAV
ncbi:MAG TPA: hypothetical protein VMZ52_14215, partial [Bryobacteraceae bacterium]|nr:hypothetical protein [Bryobacteraceae bacterium]